MKRRSASSAIPFNRCKVFFDFDNTIAMSDVVDDIIGRFAVGDRWIELEKLWKEGTIGSRECLSGQFGSVKVSKKELAEYLKLKAIDPDFKNILAFLATKKIKPVIVSDNFEFILKSILKNNGITGLEVFCNKVEFNKDQLKLSFPHLSKDCARCAHCKKNTLADNTKKNDFIIYVGDGLSDLCAAQDAHLVFAKASLLKYFRKIGRPCVPFKTLKNVLNYMTENAL